MRDSAGGDSGKGEAMTDMFSSAKGNFRKPCEESRGKGIIIIREIECPQRQNQEARMSDFSTRSTPKGFVSLCWRNKQQRRGRKGLLGQMDSQ